MLVAVTGGVACTLLAGCDGPQSALAPAGREAAAIAAVTWWMTGGTAAISLLVIALAVYATYLRAGKHTIRHAMLLVVGGGALLPTVVLGGLLVYGLAMLPPLLAPAPSGSLRVAVAGEQWWWRVRYVAPDGRSVDLANEIRLPAGRPVEFQLESRDVIHSFWIPSLAGKVDMIPGRQTRLRLEPTKAGVFRGACAEYCGSSHAYMAFAVVVTDEREFQDWLSAQAAPARAPSSDLAARGARVFLASGCGACHAVRGTEADGVIGPDLTHVASRRTLAAGRLPMDAGALRAWIADTSGLKPSVHMPAFGMLPGAELDALAAYLAGLE